MGSRIMYDENCDFCRYVKRTVEKHDKEGRLEFMPGPFGTSHNDPGNRERISLVDQDGAQISEGIDTIIHISRNVKILYPLLPLLLALKFMGVGQISYDLVASNRTLISNLLKLYVKT